MAFDFVDILTPNLEAYFICMYIPCVAFNVNLLMGA